jgi:hypothetical protein
MLCQTVGKLQNLLEKLHLVSIQPHPETIEIELILAKLSHQFVIRDDQPTNLTSKGVQIVTQPCDLNASEMDSDTILHRVRIALDILGNHALGAHARPTNEIAGQFQWRLSKSLYRFEAKL